MPLRDTPVVIMAGGRGRRLMPYTVSFPKPLAPVGDMPIVEILLRQLKRFGFRRVIFTLGYMAELIEAYLSQSKGPISELSYEFVREEEPTGTAGSLGLLKDRLSGTFIVMNGDVLTNLDFSFLVAQHRQSLADATLCTCERQIRVEYGVLDIGADGRLLGYAEKPLHRYQVAMGISVMQPGVLDHVRPGEYLDIPSLLTSLMSSGKRVMVHRHEGLWLDIGNPDEYAKAQDMVRDNGQILGIT
jgi:NDP-mannose synthase